MFSSWILHIFTAQVQSEYGHKFMQFMFHLSVWLRSILSVIVNFKPLSHLVGISRNQAEPAGMKVRSSFW